MAHVQHSTLGLYRAVRERQHQRDKATLAKAVASMPKMKVKAEAPPSPPAGDPPVGDPPVGDPPAGDPADGEQLEGDK